MTMLFKLAATLLSLFATTVKRSLVVAKEHQDERRLCTAVDEVAVIELPFNAAFTSVGEADLFVTSYFNVKVNPEPGPPPFIPLVRDLAAKMNIGEIEATGQISGVVEELTDLTMTGPPKTVWPNEGFLVPEGILPFKALLIPQGFQVAPFPGRLVVVNLDDPSRQEYVIHQSTQTGSFTGPFDENNDPAFYHNAVFFDMDNDGLLDIVTVRSGFRVGASGFHPPSGELVWFRNPGSALDPNVEWDEVVLFGGPFVAGPDIFIEMYDFENDGVPEFVTTHFFTPSTNPADALDPDAGKFSIYGAPTGFDWSVVDSSNSSALPARVKDIVTNQGKPFGIKIVDLNNDGRVDILATNHQPDGTANYPSNVPGRILAFEQPTSGLIFNDDWTVHVLLDDIRPQPTLAGASSSRLAPGSVSFFYSNSPKGKPWIVVGGDEAGKVWLLRPKPKDWKYKVKVLFDINETYGPGTTQTFLPDRNGITISTIGGVSVAPSKENDDAVLVFIPVFEARDIHVLRVEIKCNF